MVIPFAPGGASDVVARILAQKAGAALGQQIIVDSRPGAGGTVAAGIVAKAPADGYTLLFIAASHAGIGALYPSLTFDPVADFVPVIYVASSPTVIVVNGPSRYKTLGDLGIPQPSCPAGQAQLQAAAAIVPPSPISRPRSFANRPASTPSRSLTRAPRRRFWP